MVFALGRGWYGRRHGRKAHPDANKLSTPWCVAFPSTLTLLPNMADRVQKKFPRRRSLAKRRRTPHKQKRALEGRVRQAFSRELRDISEQAWPYTT